MLLITAALRRTYGHYIFVLWFLSSSIILFLAYSQPSHIGCAYHTTTHGVVLVRIQDAGLKRASRGSLK